MAAEQEEGAEANVAEQEAGAEVTEGEVQVVIRLHQSWARMPLQLPLPQAQQLMASTVPERCLLII